MIVGNHYRPEREEQKGKVASPVAQDQCAAELPVGPELPVQNPEPILQLLLLLVQPQPP